MVIHKQIPTIEIPSIQDYEICSIDEEIVSLSNLGLNVSSQYYKNEISGSYKDCYARETVARMLIKADKSLPKGYRLKIWDAYRPICIQKELWDCYRGDILSKNPGISDTDADFKTSFFVSKPSDDINKPSLHNTGGAVDLTIIDELGKELNMGTKFDDFSDKAWTNHFEEYEQNIEIRNNRRLLYWTMIDVGFTNLPSEWWHYDYGDKFWAYFNNTEAKYKGILDIDFPNRIKLI